MLLQEEDKRYPLEGELANKEIRQMLTISQEAKMSAWEECLQFKKFPLHSLKK